MTGPTPQAEKSPTPGPIYLVGQTGVGKSAVALKLAAMLGGEIVSVDSMQVYRGLDIGTAKPSLEDRKRVPHHLIDVVGLDEPFDAASFVTLAQAATTRILSRNRRPVFCGGTGLYLKAWLEGLGEAPPSDSRLRAQLEMTPISDLLRELQQKDPAMFERIDKNNPRRVVRAIEVIRLTGRRFSEQRAAWSKVSVIGEGCGVIGLEREAEDLKDRIDRRVEAMFRAGLVGETKELLGAGLEGNRAAAQAIGYRQVMEHLRGERSLEATVALVKQKTRQYAKRQRTWFQRQMAVEWLQLKASDAPEQVAQRIVNRVMGGLGKL